MAEPAGGTAPLLETRGLVRRFEPPGGTLARLSRRSGRRPVAAVDGVDLAVPRGGTVGIVGESGCGKTTLARLLAGLLVPSAGRILLDGADVGASRRTAGLRLRAGRVQMVFQDPFASLDPRWTVGRIVAEPLRSLHPGLGRAAMAARVAEALDAVGLRPADAAAFPHAFSGGQRQRIAVARALAARPALVVCDEPTASVDPSVQAQILNLMADLQDAHGIAYVLISHNLPVVRHMAATVAVMYVGRFVETGPADTVFRTPRHPYTRMLVSAVPDVSGRRLARAPIAGEVPDPARLPPGCPFHPRCPHADARCRAERPALLPADTGAHVACHAIEEGRLT
ncbi:MAG: ATP-binding cassette domain-containing protein [Alphaproteobacteria bacterium]|jgi:peptide/nickel transport system ATP-binding protein|nr:ATP-binding cassette domain-containing protein [Alphaproteobacteria bacterium]